MSEPRIILLGVNCKLRMFTQIVHSNIYNKRLDTIQIIFPDQTKATITVNELKQRAKRMKQIKAN